MKEKRMEKKNEYRKMNLIFIPVWIFFKFSAKHKKKNQVIIELQLKMMGEEERRKKFEI
jgi:hypothetical protein